MQFVAGDFVGQAVFNQTVACQPCFAFKGGRNDVGKKMVAVAFHFDVFGGHNAGNHGFNLFGAEHGVLS